MSRPRKPNRAKTHITLPKPLKLAADEFAENQGYALSDLVARLLERRLERAGVRVSEKQRPASKPKPEPSDPMKVFMELFPD